MSSRYWSVEFFLNWILLIVCFLKFNWELNRQAVVRVALDSKTIRAMPPVRKVDLVWIARRHASAKKGQRKPAIRWRASASVTPIIAGSVARLSALKAVTDPNVETFAIARTTALATVWAIVTVSADGPENCAKILVRQVPLVVDSNSWPFVDSWISNPQVSTVKSVDSPARLASMVTCDLILTLELEFQTFLPTFSPRQWTMR